MKPGWKTSEFWLSSVAVAIGAALALGLVPSDSVYEKIAGVAMAILASWGYTSARSTAKKGGKK
jgi:hypothetical protein